MEWRPSPRLDGRMEWTCEHGVGHGNGRHGCDLNLVAPNGEEMGCCESDDFPGDKHLCPRCTYPSDQQAGRVCSKCWPEVRCWACKERLRVPGKEVCERCSCRCSLRIRLVGDGCAECNPEFWRQLLEDE